MGTLHAKMGTIKDRDGMNLTEAEVIKILPLKIHRRTVQKKIFMTQIVTMV